MDLFNGVNLENFTKIKYANDNGFIINLSANNVNHADELKQYDLPIATIVGTKPINKTPEGHKIKMCPNQKNKSIKCELCQWCSKMSTIVCHIEAD